MSEPPSWSAPGASPPPPVPLDKPAQQPQWGGQPEWGGRPEWGGDTQGWGGAPTGWGGPTPLAPRPGVIPLRPLGLGEILDGAVSIVRRYPRPTLGLSAVVATVTTLLNVALVLLLLESLTEATTSDDLGDAQLGGALVLGITSAVIGGLAAIVLTGIITAVVGKAVLGDPISSREAWTAVRPLLWRLVGLSLLTGLLVIAPLVVAGLVAAGLFAAGGAGTLLLGVPLVIVGLVGVVYLYVRLALAPAALVLERSGVRPSLRRSGVLVARSFWRVLGILLLALLITGFVTSLMQVPFIVLGSFVGETASQVLAQVGAGLATALIAPFSAGVTALLYIDRRIRAEGLDVSLAAAAAHPGA